VGKLHLLDYLGNPLHELDLPAPYGGAGWNGALPAPTLDNVDGDADLELVLNTAHSGFVVYDLPGTASARILWGTGRGNYQRTGSLLHGSLQGSSMQMTPAVVAAGDTVHVTIHLQNSGPVLEGVQLSNVLPPQLAYAGNLSASSGAAAYAAGQITWSGSVEAGTPVFITYDAAVDAGLSAPTLIVNEADVDDGEGEVLHLAAAIVANGEASYLPLLVKQ
jgi:uncharacterized repeat protein (TIGR01451 family)